MPTSLEDCRLLMLAMGLGAIPLALFIEWLIPSSSVHPRKRASNSSPSDQPQRSTPTRFVVKITPKIKGIH